MKLLLFKKKSEQKHRNKLKEGLENRILTSPRHLTFIPTHCFLTLEDNTGNLSRNFGAELRCVVLLLLYFYIAVSPPTL